MKEEISFNITPNNLNVSDLYNFLTKHCKFDDVICLYVYLQERMKNL